MKQAINSYPTRIHSVRGYPKTATGVRLAWKMPRIPNFVWLAMVILAISAFSYSAYSRSRQQEREAREAYDNTAARVENAKNVNRQIKEQTARIRQNPQASAQAAQDQLRLVRRNEIVVSVR